MRRAAWPSTPLFPRVGYMMRGGVSPSGFVAATPTKSGLRTITKAEWRGPYAKAKNTSRARLEGRACGAGDERQQAGACSAGSRQSDYGDSARRARCHCRNGCPPWARSWHGRCVLDEPASTARHLGSRVNKGRSHRARSGRRARRLTVLPSNHPPPPVPECGI